MRTALLFRVHLVPQDPYGNYVVQYVLGMCSHEEAETLVNVPIGKVILIIYAPFFPPREKLDNKKLLEKTVFFLTHYSVYFAHAVLPHYFLGKKVIWKAWPSTHYLVPGALLQKKLGR